MQRSENFGDFQKSNFSETQLFDIFAKGKLIVISNNLVSTEYVTV